LPQTMRNVNNPVMMIAQMQGQPERIPIQSPNYNSLPRQPDSTTHNRYNIGANLFGGQAGMPKNTFSLPQTKQV
jgi:hypothetical protein